MALRFITQKLSKTTLTNGYNKIQVNNVFTNAALCKSEDRRQMKASLPAKDMGTIGENTTDIDSDLSK